MFCICMTACVDPVFSINFFVRRRCDPFVSYCSFFRHHDVGLTRCVQFSESIHADRTVLVPPKSCFVCVHVNLHTAHASAFSPRPLRGRQPPGHLSVSVSTRCYILVSPPVECHRWTHRSSCFLPFEVSRHRASPSGARSPGRSAVTVRLRDSFPGNLFITTYFRRSCTLIAHQVDHGLPGSRLAIM